MKNWVAPKNENENIHHYYLSSKVVGIGPVRQPEEGGYPSGKQGQAGKGVGRQKQEGISRGWRQEAGARRASTVVRQGWPRRKEDQLAAGGSVRPHVGPRACVVCVACREPQWIRPSSTACTTAAVLLGTFSFWTVFLIWKSTVFFDSVRMSAMSWEDLPSAVHFSTSISRLVR